MIRGRHANQDRCSAIASSAGHRREPDVTDRDRLATRRGFVAAGVLVPAARLPLAMAQEAGACDVRRFGAMGDGTTLDTAAINAAIEAAAANGGGRVLVPPGDYPSHSIRLKSHVSLVLSAGATIIAIEDVKLSNIFVQHCGGAAETAAIEPPELEDAYPEPGMFGPMPAHGLYIRHAGNIEVSNFEVAATAADARPAVVLDEL